MSQVLGTDALIPSKNIQTMNLGWVGYTKCYILGPSVVLAQYDISLV